MFLKGKIISKRFAIRAYLCAQRGTAAIEMALIFPIFLMFFMGVFEMGLVWFGNSIISNMVYNAVRESSTGCLGAGQSSGSCTGTNVTFTDLKNRIATASFGLVDPTKLCFSAKKIEDIINPGDVIQPGTNLDLGQGNEVRIFYAGYNWKIFFAYMRPIMGNAVQFRTYQIIRNEDFGTLPPAAGSRTGSAQNCPP